MRPPRSGRDRSEIPCRLPCPKCPSKKICEVRDQRFLGRRPLVVTQPLRSHPRQVLALPGRCDSLPTPARIERHEKMKIRITVARECERRKTRLVDPNSPPPL